MDGLHKMTKSILLSFCIAVEVFAQTDSLQNTDNSWYHFTPFRQLTLRSYVLSTHYPALTYRLVNSDGDRINRGWTPFIELEGDASLISRLHLRYTLQGTTGREILFKKGSVVLQDFGISLEFGRGSSWLGHGKNGSLLLSNNAEPFTLLKFENHTPLSIPYVGDFRYVLFHGWPTNFKILGQRLSWQPWPWIELSGSQTAIYTRPYKVWEFFRILTAAEANIPSEYNTDQRASIDLAVWLPWIKNWLPPFEEAQLYFEYAGEDLFAWWQEEDDVWVGPLGFEFLDLGTQYGLWLKTARQEIRLEYTQNYRNAPPLFRDFRGQFGYADYTYKWYGGTHGGVNPHFVNGGAIMGHHMGNAADDLYIEFQQSWDPFRVKTYFNKQRRGIVEPGVLPWRQLREDPEILYRYGLELSSTYKGVNLTALVVLNHYRNVNSTGDPLNVIPTPGRQAKESIVGFLVRFVIE